MPTQTTAMLRELLRVVRRKSGVVPGQYDPAKVTVDGRGLVTDAVVGKGTENTTKGDLTSHDGTTDVRVGVGPDNDVLTADSSAAEGVAWKPAGAGGGVDVKGGRVTGLVDGGSVAVVFNTAFAGTPNVTATLENTNAADDGIRISGISTAGFTLHVEKGHGGGSDTWDAQWIATDAGDP